MFSYLKSLLSPHYIRIKIQTLFRALSERYPVTDYFHHLSLQPCCFSFSSLNHVVSHLCAFVYAVPWM